MDLILADVEVLRQLVDDLAAGVIVAIAEDLQEREREFVLGDGHNYPLPIVSSIGMTVISSTPF